MIIIPDVIIPQLHLERLIVDLIRYDLEQH